MIPNSLFEQMGIKEIMSLLESDKIKLDILKLLHENNEMTLGRLRTKLQTGFKTIKNNCDYLEKTGFITIDIKKIGENERKITFVKLTARGKEFQDKIGISKESTPY